MSAVLEPMGQSKRHRRLAGEGANHCRPGFNRWLVPLAALAIHLCIGMAYGFSVFGCRSRAPA